MVTVTSTPKARAQRKIVFALADRQARSTFLRQSFITASAILSVFWICGRDWLTSSVASYPYTVSLLSTFSILLGCAVGASGLCVRRLWGLLISAGGMVSLFTYLPLPAAHVLLLYHAVPTVPIFTLALALPRILSPSAWPTRQNLAQFLRYLKNTLRTPLKVNSKINFNSKIKPRINPAFILTRKVSVKLSAKAFIVSSRLTIYKLGCAVSSFVAEPVSPLVQWLLTVSAALAGCASLALSGGYRVPPGCQPVVLLIAEILVCLHGIRWLSRRQGTALIPTPFMVLIFSALYLISPYAYRLAPIILGGTGNTSEVFSRIVLLNWLLGSLIAPFALSGLLDLVWSQKKTPNENSNKKNNDASAERLKGESVKGERFSPRLVVLAPLALVCLSLEAFLSRDTPTYFALILWAGSVVLCSLTLPDMITYLNEVTKSHTKSNDDRWSNYWNEQVDIRGAVRRFRNTLLSCLTWKIDISLPPAAKLERGGTYTQQSYTRRSQTQNSHTESSYAKSAHGMWSTFDKIQGALTGRSALKPSYGISAFSVFMLQGLALAVGIFGLILVPNGDTHTSYFYSGLWALVAVVLLHAFLLPRMGRTAQVKLWVKWTGLTVVCLLPYVSFYGANILSLADLLRSIPAYNVRMLLLGYGIQQFPLDSGLEFIRDQGMVTWLLIGTVLAWGISRSAQVLTTEVATGSTKSGDINSSDAKSGDIKADAGYTSKDDKAARENECRNEYGEEPPVAREEKPLVPSWSIWEKASSQPDQEATEISTVEKRTNEKTEQLKAKQLKAKEARRPAMLIFHANDLPFALDLFCAAAATIIVMFYLGLSFSSLGASLGMAVSLGVLFAVWYKPQYLRLKALKSQIVNSQIVKSRPLKSQKHQGIQKRRRAVLAACVVIVAGVCILLPALFARGIAGGLTPGKPDDYVTWQSLPTAIRRTTQASVSPVMTWPEGHAMIRRCFGARLDTPLSAPATVAARITGADESTNPLRSVAAALLGMQISSATSLDRLFELYVNLQDYGYTSSTSQSTIGISQAAQQFFSTTPSKLTAAQTNFLLNSPPLVNNLSLLENAEPVQFAPAPVKYLYTRFSIKGGAAISGWETHCGVLNNKGAYAAYTITDSTTPYVSSSKGTLILSAFILGTQAWSVNDTGEAAGSSGAWAASWNKYGDIRNLGTLPGFASCAARSINNHGVVAGYAWNSDAPDGASEFEETAHAFLWSQGHMHDLGVPDGYRSSRAYALNNHGQVAGWLLTQSGQTHAMVWQNGVFHDLGAFSGGQTSVANAINDAGQVVGSAQHQDGTVTACLWQNGRILDLGRLAGDKYSRALGINNLGQVVGESRLDTNVNYPGGTAFLWDARRGMRDLTPLFAWDSVWRKRVTHCTTALSINDHQEILGYGFYETVRVPRYHFLLVPVQDHNKKMPTKSVSRVLPRASAEL